MTVDASEPPAPRPSVVMVSTRELDGQSMAGRLRVAHAIRAFLSSEADLTVLRLPNFLTDPSLGRLLECVVAWLASVVGGPLLPLQCALFASRTDHLRLLAALPADTSAVYLDGVRSYAFLVRLRRARPHVRIVVDLDDLMSRRMLLLLNTRQPLSPGYLTKRLPAPLRRLSMSRWLGGAIVAFERRMLLAIERRMADLADALVLLSAEDARILREECKSPTQAAIEVIPPASSPVGGAEPLRMPARFVFIGSDALTQNRLTIDYLVDLWRRAGLTTPLVLFGLSYRQLDLPPGVTAAGYVDDLADVYDGSSILLTPSFIGGGIKTKVLEAFAHGAPVVGNALTFESMPLPEYPLRIEDESQLIDIISRPEVHLQELRRAAAIGASYLRERHAPTDFAHAWRRMMLPQAAPARDLPVAQTT